MRDYNELFIEIQPLSSTNRLSSTNWEETSSVFSAEYEEILESLAGDSNELNYYLNHNAG